MPDDEKERVERMERNMEFIVEKYISSRNGGT